MAIMNPGMSSASTTTCCLAGSTETTRPESWYRLGPSAGACCSVAGLGELQPVRKTAKTDIPAASRAVRKKFLAWEVFWTGMLVILSPLTVIAKEKQQHCSTGRIQKKSQNLNQNGARRYTA